jgi:hypothetical protein
MCGRFAITLPPDAMAQLFDGVAGERPAARAELQRLPDEPASTPSCRAAQRRLVGMRWGFIPHWYKTPSDGPLLINARAESIAEKPAFRAAARERRCLIPADGFYEWTKDEAATAFRGTSGARTARPSPLPGSGRTGSAEANGTPPAPSSRPRPRAASRGPPSRPRPRPARGQGALARRGGKGAALLMTSPEEGELEFFRVDPKVNSNRASGPLIDPVAA